MTKELVNGIVPVLQSLEGPGECVHRLTAASAGSHGVTQFFKDSCTPA
jgi:hypothetical protein